MPAPRQNRMAKEAKSLVFVSSLRMDFIIDSFMGTEDGQGPLLW
jgi:hypothetical protein